MNSGSNNFGPPFPDTHRKQSVQRHKGKKRRSANLDILKTDLN